MVRKQIYIESRQDTNLKQQARVLGVTEAEVIRQAIDRQMASFRLGARDPGSWDREKAFIARRMAKGNARGCRWTREDAYEDRLKHYGR